MPSYLEEADYYIRPFSIELWIYIFGCLIVGIGFGVISYLIYKRKQNHLKLVDLVFLALDSMSNQGKCQIVKYVCVLKTFAAALYVLKRLLRIGNGRFFCA